MLELATVKYRTGSPANTIHPPMFDQCWTYVVNGGPTLVKHWVDVSCLLGDVYWV